LIGMVIMNTPLFFLYSFKYFLDNYSTSIYEESGCVTLLIKGGVLMLKYILMIFALIFLLNCAGIQSQWYYQRYSTKYTKQNKWSNAYTSQINANTVINAYELYQSTSTTTGQ